MSNSRAFVREALLFALALAVCAPAAAAPAAAAPESLQPAGWDDPLQVPEAIDCNPDPGIVGIDLEARVASLEIAPGTKTEVWSW
jgi:hypothetical protein